MQQKTRAKFSKTKMEDTAQRGAFPVEGTPQAGGSFEVTAITAGVGNGWNFSADVLRASLPLWDQAQCFIDHTAVDNPDGHSVRDLAGVMTNPRWDDGRQGIVCTLQPMGPGADVLTETANEILSNPSMDPKIGFSADLEFNNEGQDVTEILKVYSVDLVVNPARGGAVLRALNAVQNRKKITAARAQIEADNSATRALLSEHEQMSAINQEAAAARAIRAEMCASLLDQELRASNLPVPIKDRIRKTFSNRLFDVKDLKDAIDDGRTLTTQLMAGSAVSGISGRFSGMYSSQDQINAAVHDLLGAKRPEGIARVQTQRLSGIRELYTMMTGDYDFHGGYDANRAQFATTADMPGILANVLNKLIAQKWDELGASGYRWWEKLVTVEHFNNLQPITSILVGEVTLMPEVAEGANYAELGVKDSQETGEWKKYGGYLGLTIEMFERDDTMKLRQYPFRLASAGLRRISSLIGSIFTANAGVGPALADSFKLFDATNHKNLLTLALNSANWEAANQAIYNQPMITSAGGVAPILATDGRYCVVPRSLQLAARRILYPSFAWESGITSENMQRGQFGDVVTCPEFTDQSDWAVVADPAVAPAIYVGERFGLMPEIYIADSNVQGALFDRDEVRIKARHFLSVFVADYRPLVKSNVVDA